MNMDPSLTPKPEPEPEQQIETTGGQRKPRVALMGEFSAGKSTLANVLLGTAPLPVRVTATRLPPVWISEGLDKAMVVNETGQEMPVDRSDLASVPLEGAQMIRLSQQAPILELCDLIDMPGISDPNMPPSVWQDLIAQVDHVIWCTHATQAWRQSEAAVWSTLADAVPGNSLLLVTQIDKLRSERDRARVLARVRKETRNQFREVYPVSLLQAETAQEDQDEWASSGARAVVERLVEMLLAPTSSSLPMIEGTPPAQPIETATPAVEPRVIPRRITRSADTSRRHERPVTPARENREGRA